MIVENTDYLDKMEKLRNDVRKFEKINFNQEKRVDNILKKVVASNSVSDEVRRSLKSVGTRSGILH